MVCLLPPTKKSPKGDFLADRTGLGLASRRLPPPRAGHCLAVAPPGRVSATSLRRSRPDASKEICLLPQRNKKDPYGPFFSGSDGTRPRLASASASSGWPPRGAERAKQNVIASRHMVATKQTCCFTTQRDCFASARNDSLLPPTKKSPKGDFLADRTGLEPAVFAVTGRCVNQTTPPIQN